MIRYLRALLGDHIPALLLVVNLLTDLSGHRYTLLGVHSLTLATILGLALPLNLGLTLPLIDSVALALSLSLHKYSVINLKAKFK